MAYNPPIIHYRYFKDGKYKDHGRDIYPMIPVKGQLIEPFNGVRWIVVDVNKPSDDLTLNEVKHHFINVHVRDINVFDFCVWFKRGWNSWRRGR